MLEYHRIEMDHNDEMHIMLPDGIVAIAMRRGTDDLDVAGRRPITADALDALKLSVGISASRGNSWKELIAADMNQDGRVTAANALKILKASVGVDAIEPAWVFVSDNALFNSELAKMTRSTVHYKSARASSIWHR